MLHFLMTCFKKLGYELENKNRFEALRGGRLVKVVH